MTQITLRARVGPDGVLHLPLGEAQADRDVRVTIEPAGSTAASSREEYLAFLVEKADEEEVPIEEIDRDFAVLTAMCQDSDPVQEEQLERALQEARRQAKDQVRRQMGLP
jgi:hypothetical protein